MNVVLTHAYSTTNSGDGLLVVEAAEIVRDAYPNARITLLALDPAGFGQDDFERVLHPLLGSTSESTALQQARLGARTLWEGHLRPDVRRVIDAADLVVAVGGGYLRAKNPLEAIKMGLAHLVQIPNKPTTQRVVYLPQSIGPLRYGTHRLVTRRLTNASAVFVRDERSRQGLSALDNVQRLPDMALLGLPSEWSRNLVVAPSADRPIGVVARALPGSARRIKRYDDAISGLSTIPKFELLAQATARGNNDPAYYESLGFNGGFRSLLEAVAPDAERRPSAVVSVRLHGSLQSIRSGVPSIHLSYERKGFGAYSDLGLSRYVHNAFDFDPGLVREQVEELREDASGFWDAVEASIPKLTDDRRMLIETLRGNR